MVEAEDGGPAMKLTEVFLWDDGTRSDMSFSPKQTKSAEDDGGNGSDEGEFLAEDMELLRKMNELGLPVSFQTNREKPKRKIRGKREGMNLKHPNTSQDVVSDALDSSKLSVEESESPIIFDDNGSSSLCSVSRIGQSESSFSGVAVDATKLHFSIGEGDNPPSLLETSTDFTEVEHDGTLGIVSDDGLNCDCLHNGVVDATTVLANSVGCPEDTGNGNGQTELDERLMEHVCLECSLMSCLGEELPKTGETHVPEQPCVSESLSDSTCPVVLYNDGIDSQKGGDFGDWMVYWDSYYKRNYFYNVRTDTSTWYPPEGMEHLETVDITSYSNEGVVDVAQLDEIHTSDLPSGKCVELYTSNILEHDEPVETLSMSNSLTEKVDDRSTCLETGVPVTDELVMKSDLAVVKRKKKVRRRRKHRRFSHENEVIFEGLLKEGSADIGKYWCQRYLLFSRYDDGIKMDEEGWFSITPEALARHHAQRCGSGIIIDCFTGVGGNAIQFAQISKHVTAIDIDPTKIDYVQHNAANYRVDARIDFIKGNFFLLASRLKIVFLSPPWGGPDYAREETYDIMTMLKPYDGCFLFNTAKQVASKIVMFLPRNVDVNQLAELSLSATPPWYLEVEKNFVNGKLKGISAYFSCTLGFAWTNPRAEMRREKQKATPNTPPLLDPSKQTQAWKNPSRESGSLLFYQDYLQEEAGFPIL